MYRGGIAIESRTQAVKRAIENREKKIMEKMLFRDVMIPKWRKAFGLQLKMRAELQRALRDGLDRSSGGVM